MGGLQSPFDGLRRLLNGAQIAGHGAELAALLIEVLQRLGLLVVDRQPGAYRLRLVVVALDEGAAAGITCLLYTSRCV